LLTPEDAPDTRVIVGTWRSREDWQVWHQDPAFLEQHGKLAEFEAEPSVTAWYLVADAQASPD
jgi:heme-degrading monooxygenase HmoA